jgi:transcriptional regulator with XRE-family HTH domain
VTPEALKAWRKSLGFPQRAAAEALGMSLANYQQLERGVSWTTGKPVTIDKRTALACAAIRAGLAPEGD